MLPRSIAGRVFLAGALTVVVSIATLAAVAPVLIQRHETDVLAERLRGDAEIVASLVAAPLRSGDQDALDALARELAERAGIRVTLIRADGTVVGESHEDRRLMDDHSGRPEVASALRGETGRSIRRSDTVRADLLYVAVPIRDSGRVIGVARGALPVATLDALAARLSGAILAAAAAGGLVALGLAFLLGRALSRPLSDLARRARDGTIPGWTDRGGIAEVSDLGSSLARMSRETEAAQRTVAEERDRLATVIRELTDGVLITDAEDRVVLANPRAEELLDAGPLVGRRLHEVARDHEVLDAARRARSEGEVSALVERIEPARYVRVAARALRGGELVLALQDLSRIRRLETVRRDFVANVSHELRTPISSIRAMVETLEGGALDDRPAARDFLARIHREVDDLAQLVAELLTLGRVESGEDAPRLEDVSASDLLDRAAQRLRPLADRAGVALVRGPADAGPVRADAEKIGQVLTNLIHNAIKFTEPGGRVELTASAEHGRVRFRVTDTGVGLTPEEVERVFERFYKGERSRAGHGSGLGLAIAKHIVQAHGGTISAESPGPGRGSTFSFTLPAAGGGDE